MDRRFTPITFVLLLAGVSVAGELTLAKDRKSPEFAARILTIIDVVIDQHIDPPAVQQMILQGVKSLYATQRDRQMPADLARQVSALSDQNQIAEYLSRIRLEFAASDVDVLEATIVNGILRSLPGNCMLVGPEEQKVQEQIRNNRYVGTGIALSAADEGSYPKVANVMYDGPAWRSGMKKNDVILEVDGASTKSMSMNDVIDALRGDEGMGVSVVVRQPDTTDARTLNMVRGRVFMPSVRGDRELSPGRFKYTLQSAPDIAVFNIATIGPSTLHELRKAASQLRNQEIHGVILSINGAGNSHDAVVVADGLLDEGTMGYLQTRTARIPFAMRSGSLFGDLPMVVFLYESASAGSLWLATALRDNARAIVISAPNRNSDLVDSTVDIPGDNRRLQLATARLLREDLSPVGGTRFIHATSLLQEVGSEGTNTRETLVNAAVKALRDPAEWDRLLQMQERLSKTDVKFPRSAN